MLKNSMSYYHQGNEMEKYTNKNIINSIKKMLFQKKISWDTMLIYALWENRVTTKKAIGTSPFQLVYGTDVVFHVQLGILVKRFMWDSE